MKILDKYVIKNFMVGYIIAFCVLVGLRVIIDLFVNLDEFTEHAELETLAIIKNISIYYALNVTLYFRDFSGMIMVVAAAFSFGKMVRNGELVAILASGVSLKRVMAPIFIICMLLTAILVVDQELLIPSLSDKLVRSHDDLPGKEIYDVHFISDAKGSLIYTSKFDVRTSTLYNPTIITRSKKNDADGWNVTGRIDAEKAVFNDQTGNWDLTGGIFTSKDVNTKGGTILFYKSNITPKDILIQRKSENKTLLNSRQLSVLAVQAQKNKQIKDLAQLYSQKHFRVTDPLFNMVMLMVCLPILVCRNPKDMKTAVMISFSLTGTCMVVSFISKLLAAEEILGIIRPEFWAWLPVFIFLPIAFIELDSMKT